MKGAAASVVAGVVADALREHDRVSCAYCGRASLAEVDCSSLANCGRPTCRFAAIALSFELEAQRRRWQRKSAARHELKCDPEHFEAVLVGAKRAEIRRDDRHFGVGDVLSLREYDRASSSYTGRSLELRVSHVLRGFEGLAPGFVALSLSWIGGAR